MLIALRVDTDRRDEDQILVHVNAVDLDHQQIEAREIGRHPLLHARRRQRYKAAGGGRFRQTSPRRRRNVSLGQPTERANLRVETLISIWFMAHLPSQSSATAASQLGTACSLP